MKLQILIIISILITGAGFFQLSNATLGVGLVSIGIFLAILARIYQSSVQHKELMHNQQKNESESAN